MDVSNGRSAGQSPFSRPPQPRPASASGSTFTAAAPRPQPSATTTTAPPSAEHAALQSQRRSGGQWFYWVAALSLINAGVALAGQEWRFILGLGVTQLVQELAQESGGAAMKAGLVGLAVIGIFGFLGQRAVAGYRWAFLAGMILYGLDGLIFLMVQDWVGVGFHAFVLAMVGRGYAAALKLPEA
jgi:hypothetical protein